MFYGQATELPFSGKLLHLTAMGDYSAAGCSSVLFHPSAKFDSGCGWSSFDRNLAGRRCIYRRFVHGMVRTEVTCSACGGHLGHVFDDGLVTPLASGFVLILALEFLEGDEKPLVRV